MPVPSKMTGGGRFASGGLKEAQSSLGDLITWLNKAASIADESQQRCEVVLKQITPLMDNANKQTDDATRAQARKVYNLAGTADRLLREAVERMDKAKQLIAKAKTS